MYVRKTPVGTYLCVPYGFKLETFHPTLQIEEPVEMLLNLCDGTHTRDAILQKLSEESGEPVEEIAEGFDEFVAYMIDEGVLEWSEEPSFVDPIHKGNRPFSVSLDVTTACNLQCPFCAADAGYPQAGEMTLDDLAPLVEQLKRLKPSPINLTGGEPLLRKEKVLYILEELFPFKEIVVTIFTNGTLITKDYAQQLYDAGLRFARVSVDGHTEELNDAIRGKGSFKKTIQGIEYLRELGIHVNTMTVVSDVNYMHIDDMRNSLLKIADSVDFTPILTIGRAKNPSVHLGQEKASDFKLAIWDRENLQLNVTPRTRCLIGETIYIQSDGDVYPCFYLQFPEFKAGNILENDFSKIYETNLMRDFLVLTIDDIEGCRDCDIRYYCGAGCRGFAYATCGSLYCPDPVECEPNKNLVRRILESGEENTKKLMQELLEATRRLENQSLGNASLEQREQELEKEVENY